MQAFEFYSPTQIVFGPNCEQQVGQLVQRHGGSRVFLVYGGQSAVKSGLLQRMTDALAQSGLAVETLGGVQPNPRLALAREGVKRALEFGADFVLGVGGGSVLDTAKAIACGVANEGTDIWDLWLRKVPLQRVLPVGAVLTIAAAGSESSDSAVLTNGETHEKRGLGSDLIRPRFALLDPTLTYTLPEYQTGCGIVDIMMHTMDRYFNPTTCNELTDEIAEGLLRTVIRNGPIALAQPDNYQARSELMWAGSLSHNNLTGLGNTKDFTTHQLGHELSAMFDVAHGASLSAVWASFARYCIKADPARFARFGEKVWGLDGTGKSVEQQAMDAIDATEAFFRSVNMPVCFSELKECGVLREEQLRELAWRCTFYGKRTIGAFQVLDGEDILAIYRMANH